MRRTPRMCELFVEQLREDIDFIAEAEVAGEAEQLRKRAHRLKGAAYAFGARPVGDVALEIEQRAKVGRTDLASLIPKLSSLFEETVAELASVGEGGNHP